MARPRKQNLPRPRSNPGRGRRVDASRPRRKGARSGRTRGRAGRSPGGGTPGARTPAGRVRFAGRGTARREKGSERAVRVAVSSSRRVVEAARASRSRMDTSEGNATGGGGGASRSGRSFTHLLRDVRPALAHRARLADDARRGDARSASIVPSQVPAKGHEIESATVFEAERHAGRAPALALAGSLVSADFLANPPHQTECPYVRTRAIFVFSRRDPASRRRQRPATRRTVRARGFGDGFVSSARQRTSQSRRPPRHGRARLCLEGVVRDARTETWRCVPRSPGWRRARA